MCGNEKEPEKTSLRAGENNSKPTKRAKELSRHKYFTINVYQENGEVYIEGERADDIVENEIKMALERHFERYNFSPKWKGASP
ncbi:MAG: hypothetical protein DRN17_00090 [Thermoplasmata archaeon]|nr:MAG: hypothetical protein DRN17_00090 [Thermoplasmata archaeon]